MTTRIASVDDVLARLRGAGYVADRPLATTLYLADRLGKPILAEGPAGVGKTELAKALAAALGAELMRLQCYEGLDEAKTLYEWEYPKQLLYTQILRDKIGEVARRRRLARARRSTASPPQEDAFFSERFLLPRPLLRAIRRRAPRVLLIDEVDRAEAELEAFFLEVLAEFQVTVPELGTLRAAHRPLVMLTSNNTRELSDALRRRCLTCGSTIPTPSASRRSCARACRSRASALAAEVVRVVRRCARSTSRRARASPRPSTGRARWWC